MKGLLHALFIYDNQNGMVMYRYLNKSFPSHHEDLVVNFLRAIDTFSSQYSGKGADIFQTETIRIIFERSLEFNFTFACSTNLTEPIKKDKELLETIKYAFIHRHWEIFTTDKRTKISPRDKNAFDRLIESI
ncbi:hypothetical protein GF325_18795 [Candidatus Bathyarchaeota archaeon]|nr:hypothetical protein [Candidatus Bathyarchaeota archaeon]